MSKESKISLVESSFEKIKLHRDVFAEYFYDQLFIKKPEIKPLFAKSNIEALSKKLFAALVLLVENLRNTKELERVLLPLGKRHKDYGATAYHYPIISSILLDSIKHFLKEDWSPEVSEAWQETLDSVTSMMLEGARNMEVEQRLLVGLGMDGDYEKIKLAQNHLYELVETSFRKIKEYPEEFPITFYKNLFHLSPELKPLFEKVEMRMQAHKLFSTLSLLVENLRHPKKLEEVLGHLGDKHRAYGTIAHHYPIVGNALLRTLREYLKEDWTPEVRQAWIDTYSQVMRMMLKGTVKSSSNSGKKIAPKIPVPNVKAKTQSSSNQYEINISARQKYLLKNKNGILSKITDWFWRVEKWKVAVIISVIFISIAPIKNELFLSFVNILDPLSIVLALYLFIKESPERKKQYHYQAWSIVDSAHGIKSSHARIIALQDLCDEGFSLKGLDLSNAELSKIELDGCDLTNVNFAGAILKEAELYKADLNHANLSNAICTGIVFSKANLGFASMHKGNFSSADFSNANLMFADMSAGNYSGANFRNALMKGAKFEGAYMSGADFTGAEVNIEDLKQAYIVNAIMPDGSVVR